MRGRVPGHIALTIALIPGCGADDGLGRRYPVRGAVTYQGRPLETGRITFDPIDADSPTRVATGTVTHGAYTLSTAGGDDGALPGRYRVGIVAWSTGDSKVRGITEGGAARQSDVLNAARKARDLIPRRYRSPSDSGLVREVKAETNHIDFDLVD